MYHFHEKTAALNITLFLSPPLSHPSARITERIEWYLRHQDGGQHQVSFLLILDNIGVLMHAEDARRGAHRQFSHVIQELTVLADRRHVIKAAGIEQVSPIGLDHVLVIELREDRVQGTPVPFVGHATAVIALASKRRGIKGYRWAALIRTRRSLSCKIANYRSLIFRFLRTSLDRNLSIFNID